MSTVPVPAAVTAALGKYQADVATLPTLQATLATAQAALVQAQHVQSLASEVLAVAINQAQADLATLVDLLHSEMPQPASPAQPATAPAAPAPAQPAKIAGRR